LHKTVSVGFNLCTFRDQRAVQTTGCAAHFYCRYLQALEALFRSSFAAHLGSWLLRHHSERSEESLFGLFRATKSIHTKEFFPLLANFIDETNGTAVRQLRGAYLPPTAFPLLPGLPALPTLLPRAQKQEPSQNRREPQVTLTE
jgi:hypothetical protein